MLPSAQRGQLVTLAVMFTSWTSTRAVGVGVSVLANASHMRARVGEHCKANLQQCSDVRRKCRAPAERTVNLRQLRAQEVATLAQHAPNSRGGALNPTALAPFDAARVLARVGGGAVTEAMVQADLEAGAPANVDGTINLVHYAAWLVQEMAGDGG